MNGDVIFGDYPNEPIGGGNPYYRCIYCKISDPQINGRLSGHAKNCEWVIKKTQEIELLNKKEILNDLVNELKNDCNRYKNGICQSLICLQNGGYDKSQKNFDLATCKRHEQIKVLEKLINLKL
jgi:hypothetical protein